MVGGPGLGDVAGGGVRSILDRHLFEQIQRRTLALRREVQPVPVVAYAGFLRLAGAAQEPRRGWRVTPRHPGNCMGSPYGRGLGTHFCRPGCSRFQPDDLAKLANRGRGLRLRARPAAGVRFFPCEGRLFSAGRAAGERAATRLAS